ncbi:MAG TPA: metallophosphoesterase [Fibrobacteria bacterium]|nr:metallophosphoesterase [Fibrobacteria bacterium]
MPSGAWKRIRRLIPAAAALVCIFSCELFEYSPYEVPARDRGDARLAAELSRIASTDGPERSFSFAVIADIQSTYDELKDGVGKINADSSIRFVLVAGDLTQYGLLREFEWVRDGLDRLDAPYLPVIGNHDALANGTEIFRRMFGPLDFSFTYRGARFVIFNDNVWQFDAPVPDTAWLDAELSSAAPESLRLVPVTHIPPWGDQMTPALDTALTEMFARHHATLCVFAHLHNYHFHVGDAERRPYVVADNMGGRNFVKITLAEDTIFTVERVFF